MTPQTAGPVFPLFNSVSIFGVIRTPEAGGGGGQPRRGARGLEAGSWAAEGVGVGAGQLLPQEGRRTSGCGRGQLAVCEQKG